MAELSILNLLIVLAVILFFFGGRRIPETMRWFGEEIIRVSSNNCNSRALSVFSEAKHDGKL